MIQVANSKLELYLIKVYGENEYTIEDTQGFEITDCFLPDKNQALRAIQSEIGCGSSDAITKRLSNAFGTKFGGRWDCFLINRSFTTVSSACYYRSDKCVRAQNSKAILYLIKVHGESDYTVEDTRSFEVKFSFLPDKDQVLHIIQNEVGCGSASEMTERLSKAFTAKYGGCWDCFLINRSFNTVSSVFNYNSDTCVHALNPKAELFLIKVHGESEYALEDTRGFEIKDCFLPDKNKVLQVIQSEVGCGSAKEIGKRLSNAFDAEFGGHWDCFLMNSSFTTVAAASFYSNYKMVRAVNSKLRLYLVKVCGESEYTAEDTRGFEIKSCCLSSDKEQALRLIHSKIGTGRAKEMTKRLAEAFNAEFGGRWDCFLINPSFTTVSSAFYYQKDRLLRAVNDKAELYLVKVSD